MQFSKNKKRPRKTHSIKLAYLSTEKTRKCEAAYKTVISIAQAHALGHKGLHNISDIQNNTTTVGSEVT